MQKLILLVALLLLGNAAMATKDIRKTDDRTFFISFLDTTFVYEIKLNLTYLDSAGSRSVTLVSNDDVITLADTLSYLKLEKELNKLGLKYNAGHLISQFSAWEIFSWIYTTVYGESTRPIAGMLHLVPYAQVFEDNQPEGSYRQRIRQTDSLMDRLEYSKLRVLELQRQLVLEKAKKDTIKKVDPIATVYAAILDRYLNANESFETKNQDLLKGMQIGSNPYLFKVNDLLTDDLRRINALIASVKFLRSKYSDTAMETVKHQLSALRSANIFWEPGIQNSALKQLLNYALSESTNKDNWAPLTDIPNYDAMLQYLTYKREILRGEVSSNLSMARDYDLSQGPADQQEQKTIDSVNVINQELNEIKKELRSLRILDVREVQIQFERGFIENVKVLAQVDGIKSLVTFENSFAIGFSSRYNYAVLSRTPLYARLGTKSMYIFLADVIRNYDNEIDNYTRDYSPADTVIRIDPHATPRVALYKSHIVNLFESKFYTDLQGLSNNQPNGLVQLEISRRLNLNTMRYGRTSNFNYGYLNYLYTFGALTKIEKSYRELPLHNQNAVVNRQLVSPSYATNLEFLQYRNFQAGVELNAFTLDFPNLKSTVTIDAGAQYGHVPVIDSTRRVLGSGALEVTKDTLHMDAHLLTLYPRIMIQVFPERRLGLTFSYQPQHTRVFSNNQFKQIASYGKSDLRALTQEPRSRWSHMLEAVVKVEVSKTSASYFFLRTRFYWQQGDVNTFFSHAQLGYSYNLNIIKAGDR